MCSIAYEPCDENSFKIGPPIFSGELNGVCSQYYYYSTGSADYCNYYWRRHWHRGFGRRRREPDIAVHGRVPGVQRSRHDALRFRRIHNGRSTCYSLYILIKVILVGLVFKRVFFFFITQPQGGPGICDLLHCGNNFCTDNETPCRIESEYLHNVIVNYRANDGLENIIITHEVMCA